MHDGIEEFLTHLQQENGYSNNTIFAYKNDLYQFTEFVEQVCQIQSWSQLSVQCLNRYSLDLRERDYATSTMARKTAAVRKFCGYLTDSGVLREDPSPGLTSPKVAKSTPKALTRDEVDRLISEPLNSTDESEVIQLRDRAMLTLLYGAGMRVSELVNLDVSDVELSTPQIFCRGKQDRIRSIPISSEVQSAVSAYLSESRPSIVKDPSEQALFLNHRGQRLTRQGFWLILRRYAADVGLEDVTPHTLRHSFATHQIMEGKELEDVQQTLGHVSSSTTQVYEQMARDMTIQEDSSADTDSL